MLQEFEHQDFIQLTDKFVPEYGKCDTDLGEILRATMRIYYNFYKYRLGNNVSGSLVYLKERLGLPDNDTYYTIYKYAVGRVYQGNYKHDKLHIAIDKLVHDVYQYVKEHQTELENAPNEDDLSDYELYSDVECSSDEDF